MGVADIVVATVPQVADYYGYDIMHILLIMTLFTYLYTAVSLTYKFMAMATYMFDKLMDLGARMFAPKPDPPEPPNAEADANKDTKCVECYNIPTTMWSISGKHKLHCSATCERIPAGAKLNMQTLCDTCLKEDILGNGPNTTEKKSQ